ncbi:MAG TPA: hypothetical protein VNG51_23675 [Ktedonobacteraceae bacterium]|nr:hypothetical protein [Ktedonobacteraceae bacterium]
MSNQYPYDNYPPNPDWQNNSQQQPDYSQNGYAQQHTQYEQPPYVQPTEYAQPDPYAQPLPNMYAPPHNLYGEMAQQYAPASDSRAGFAIAGLILGILSILSSWIPICGLPLPIIGIVMSALGRRSFSHRTMAMVGLILSIAAIVIGVAITAIGLIATSHTSTTTTPGP